jgi:signal transduction histidine kinase
MANDKLFIASASHALKAPLRHIIRYTELVLTGYDLPADAGDLLESVLERARTLQVLVADLIDLARIGKEEPLATVNIEQVVSQVCLQLIDERVTITVQPNIPDFTGRETLAFLLFQNLIDNAIKYNKSDDPQITIGYDGRYFVEDNGTGIPIEYRTGIFQPFSRLDANISGSGLGLSICHDIVTSNGGRIWIEDRKSGQGSRFCFTIGGP